MNERENRWHRVAIFVQNHVNICFVWLLCVEEHASNHVECRVLRAQDNRGALL